MNRRVWPWLLVGLYATGCIDRSRLNSSCEWTNDSSVALDLTLPADRQHLIADAQLAEGLAVRRADTEHKQRFGYGGHGGLIEHGRVLHECFGALANRIERDHGVTAAQIDEARGQRSPAFDVAVAVPFLALYVFSAVWACWRIRRTFSDSPLFGGIAVAAASIAFSALGVQLGVMWSAIWECVRIGDDHFGSFRAARPPWGDHALALFAGGIVLFSAIALADWIVNAPFARATSRSRESKI